MEACESMFFSARRRRVLLCLVLLLNFHLSAHGVHVSVMNRLGSGKVMTLHCRSGDTDLGQQTVADGSEFGWDFGNSVLGNTLFFCDLGFDQSAQPFHFDSYDFGRDYIRCENKCLWLVSREGMYGLSDQTGFWEYMYPWQA